MSLGLRVTELLGTTVFVHSPLVFIWNVLCDFWPDAFASLEIHNLTFKKSAYSEL